MSIYSDLEIEFNTQTDGDIQKDEDIEAIKNSLINIVKTMPGSRRMLPTFASDINHLLFEPLDKTTANSVADSIIAAIKVWEDRIDVVQIGIIIDEDNNWYECKVDFTVRGIGPQNQVYTVDFIIKRV